MVRAGTHLAFHLVDFQECEHALTDNRRGEEETWTCGEVGGEASASCTIMASYQYSICTPLDRDLPRITGGR
jgi:hypothetical protein